MRAFIVAAIAALIAPAASAYDEPAHTVMISEGKFEVRAYEPKITASVTVTANHDQASSRGFNPLGGYIFGKNQARDKIAMTSPVTQSRSQKIDMTTPVTQTSAGQDQWKVSFVMPAEWTLDTLPIPNDQRIVLETESAVTFATIRFAGRAPARTQTRKQAELESWIAEKGYSIVGEPVYAFYDAPWTPGPLRRNEVMIPVALQ